MLTLKIKKHIEKFPVPRKLTMAFDRPIIFYTYHPADTHCLLPTAVIIDCKKQQATHFISYSQENLRKITLFNQEKNFLQARFINCHSTIDTGANGFYAFVEDAAHFYHFRPNNKTMRILLGEDLKLPERKRVTGFGSTFFSDDQDGHYFYFTAFVGQANQKKKTGAVNWYRTSLDLQKIIKVYTQPEKSSEKCPHATKKYGTYLFNSDFLRESFQLVQSGKIFRSQSALFHYIFENIYRDFCQSLKIPFHKKDFQKAVRPIREDSCFHEMRSFVVLPDFAFYLESLYGNKNFKEICDSRENWRFVLTSGQFTFIDLKKKVLKRHKTTCAAPAHFEIDQERERIYVSSHNFANFRFFNPESRRLFFGPAALDRFDLVQGKLKKVTTFTNPKGYRFTNHRIFYFREKSYICTFGEPNRLFFVDGETMRLVHQVDLGSDYLSKTKDVTKWINQNYRDLQKINFVAFEVSRKNGIIFIINDNSIIFYSFPERRIVKEVKFAKKKKTLVGVSLHEFSPKIAHCQYFS